MDINNNNAPSALDNLRYPLEQQLLDTLRGKCSPANDCGLNTRGLNRRRGKSPFFTSSDQELIGGLDGSNQSKCVCLKFQNSKLKDAMKKLPHTHIHRKSHND